VSHVAVVGAGVMGAGIAQSLAVAGCEVVLIDLDAEVLSRAAKEIRSGRFGLDSAVARGKLEAEGADAAAGRIRYETDLAAAGDVGSVGLALEAVPENLALKIAVFRRLDALLPPDAILASNTSGFPVAALAAATDRSAQVVGWHWASPAPVMRLAEIVRTPDTSQATLDTVSRLALRAGKNPVVVNDAPTNWGFVANRVYAAAHREALRVVEEGVATPEQVDRLLVDCFRWPTGPFGMSAGASSGWSG
jgi:3-hydroxybutyryl-CoA dehydrogenase